MNEAYLAGIADGMEKTAFLGAAFRSASKAIGNTTLGAAIKVKKNGWAATRRLNAIDRGSAATAGRALGINPTQIHRQMQAGGLKPAHFDAMRQAGVDQNAMAAMQARNAANQAIANKKLVQSTAATAFNDASSDKSLKAGFSNAFKTPKRVLMGTAVAAPLVGVGSAAFGAASQPAVGVNDQYFNPGY